MSIVLDPTLSNAQDNLVRNPIVELISTQPIPAIPFDGEYFNSSDIPETHPDLLSHSSGKMVLSYVKNDEDLVFMYTDVDRLFWTEVIIDLGFTNYSLVNISICELVNGSIGVVLTIKYGSNYKLQYMILSISGGIVTNRTDIATSSSPNIISEPFVYRLQDDSYFLVYSYYDGTDYFIYKRTSTNFTSWSASGAITLSGFDSTYNSNHPSLIQVASGDIFLFLDHITDKSDDNTVTNIFNLISDDGGVTWGAPSQLTTYTSMGSGGVRPYPTITSTNVIKLSFHEKNSILYLNQTSTLWQNDCSNPGYSSGSSVHYDSVTKKLYVTQIRHGSGIKKSCGIVVVDTETMGVERNYNTGTIPSYSDYFFDHHCGTSSRSQGKYTMVFSGRALFVVNDETETITHYAFSGDAAYPDIVANLRDWEVRYSTWGPGIFGTWIDEANNKLYVGLSGSYLYCPHIMVGYIDLTEEADPVDGKYTWNEIAYITSWNNTQTYALPSAGGLLVINELNRFCVYGITGVSQWMGRFGVYDLTTGNTIKEYTQDNTPSFPYNGIGNCSYKDNRVFGKIHYSTSYGQGTYRGLCDINIVEETVLYHRPSYAVVNNYDFRDVADMGDDRIALADHDYGIAIYNLTDDSWILYNEDNVAGFTSYNLVTIAYNASDDVFYTGSCIAAGSGESGYSGVRAIPATGSFEQGKYKVGTLAATWEFSESLDFSIGLSDFDFAVAIDEEGILWSLWVRKDLAFYSIKWDKEQVELDLTPYLTGSVGVSWDIGSGSNLTFQLSHGHLFDINNSLSTLYIFIKKGRSIMLRFGEEIGGVDYWQNQGTFYVKTTSVSYLRGKYPTMSVSCEDKISLFNDVKVVVSEYYNEQYPEDLIKDVVQDYTNLELGDISIEDFDTRHTIWYQIVDKNLLSSIKDILNHFGYFMRMDVDGKLYTKKVRTSVDSVDHVYASTAGTVVNFTPDDNYSNFLNRIIVKGELRDPLEVLYAEEMVGSLAGSGGWWSSGNTKETVYFSEDNERKCRNVRLETIISIKDFEILWQESNGDEYISYRDPNELYVEVTIEFPGLQGVLIGLLATVVTIGAIALWCDYEEECGIFIMFFSMLMSAVGYLLGQVANYEYELYGRPVGEVKQTVQAIADDEEFQTYLGIVLSEEITDEFCYSVTSCQSVADYELGIVKAQRKRVSFSKIAHLQDEIGDIVQIYHPYSEQTLDVFITSLRRTFVKGKSGTFIDRIEGWNL